MPCSRRNPGSSSNNTVLGTSALPMYRSTYQLEPAGSGFRWMSVDRGWVEILNPDNDLRRSMDSGGSPWKVEVERAKGIEPSALAWEARVLPLYDARTVAILRRLLRSSQRYCAALWQTTGSRPRYGPACKPKVLACSQARSTTIRKSRWPEARYLRSKGVIADSGAYDSATTGRCVIRCTAKPNSAR